MRVKYLILFLLALLLPISFCLVEVKQGTVEKIFINVLNSTGGAELNASCYADVYYENNTLIASDIKLEHYNGSLYYFNSSSNWTTGRYWVEVTCTTPEGTGNIGFDFLVVPERTNTLVYQINQTTLPEFKQEILNRLDTLENNILSNLTNVNETIHQKLDELKNITLEINSTTYDILNKTLEIIDMLNCTIPNAVCDYLYDIYNVLTNNFVLSVALPYYAFTNQTFNGYISSYTPLGQIDLNNLTIKIVKNGNIVEYLNYTNLSTGLYLFNYTVPWNFTDYEITFCIEGTYKNITKGTCRIVKIVPLGPYFDVRVETDFDRVEGGHYLPINITIKNKGTAGDVRIIYFIEIDNTRYVEHHEFLWMDEDQEVTLRRELYVPTFVPNGIGYVKVIVYKQDSEIPAEAIKTIEIGRAKDYFPQLFKDKYAVKIISNPKDIHLTVYDAENNTVFDFDIQSGFILPLRFGKYTFVFSKKGYFKKTFTMWIDQNIEIKVDLTRLMTDIEVKKLFNIIKERPVEIGSLFMILFLTFVVIF